VPDQYLMHPHKNRHFLIFQLSRMAQKTALVFPVKFLLTAAGVDMQTAAPAFSAAGVTQ
jgi:hypothetical protein